MNFFNEFTGWFDALDKNLQLMWDQSKAVYSSVEALKTQIDYLTEFLKAIHQYSVILLIMLGVQFVVILILWAGQSSIKRKLDNIEARMIAPKGDK